MSKPQDIPTHSSPSSHTILVVDDERMVLELVCRILRLHGYTVLQTTRGMEALRICQEQKGSIHLLLTDVLMPEMNGRTLAEQVIAQHPHIQVLYMSGCTDGVFITPFGSKTDMAFIQKPFEADALIHKVREVLGAAG